MRQLKKATPTDEMRGLCIAVGFVTLNWGVIERQLDTWSILIMKHYGGKEIRKDLPISLKQKTAFLRKAFRTIPALRPFMDDALDLIDRVSEVADKRHDFVHGEIERLTPETFEFTRIEYSENHHHIKRKKFSAKNYPTISRTFLDLGKDTRRFSRRLLKSIPLLKQ